VSASNFPGSQWSIQTMRPSYSRIPPATRASPRCSIAAICISTKARSQPSRMILRMYCFSLLRRKLSSNSPFRRVETASIPYSSWAIRAAFTLHCKRLRSAASLACPVTCAARMEAISDFSASILWRSVSITVGGSAGPTKRDCKEPMPTVTSPVRRA